MSKVQFFDEEHNRGLEIETFEPQEAITFDPGEFKRLLHYAAEVADGSDTTPRDHIFLDDQFMDQGLQSVYGAMHLRFGNDVVKAYSFMWRYSAFLRLFRSGVLGEDFLEKQDGHTITISPLVVRIIASFPLNSQGEVDPTAFMAELRKHAKVCGPRERPSGPRERRSTFKAVEPEGSPQRTEPTFREDPRPIATVRDLVC